MDELGLPVGWTLLRQQHEVAPLRALAAALYARLPDPTLTYVPTADSILLPDPAPALAILAALRPWLSAQLGPTLLLAREQLWLRRQYPRAQAPALHAPHSWHQDGALGARFQSPEPLLEMLTLWCPLDDCGRDAPGLELATQHEEILPLATLAQRHSGVCPQMQAGDILVMRGGLLHRSHVSPSMSRVRTSLELRVLPRVPPRLANQAFVEI